MSIFAQVEAPDLIARRNNSSRIPDLLFGFIFPMAALDIAGVPVNELFALLMVGIAFMRQPRYRLPSGVVLLLGLFLTEMVVSGLINEYPFNIRRIGHLMIWAGVMTAIAQGRINVMSMARGLGLGIAFGALVSLPSLVTGRYTGRLTGVFGDPNAAGMVVVVGAPWAIAMLPQRWRILVALVAGATVILTFSRTSLLAMAAVIIWVALAGRFNVYLALLLVIPTAFWASSGLESLRLAGPFESRGGSDLLRERIGEAAQERLAVAPWYGYGPGQGTVDIANGTTFFLHNSFDALRLEGGWPALIIVCALALIAFVPASTAKMDHRNAWFEGSLIAAIICAVNLGEVLLEIQFAAAAGALMLMGAVQRNRVATPSGPVDATLSQGNLPMLQAESADDDAFIVRIRDGRSSTLTRDRSRILSSDDKTGLLAGSKEPSATRIDRPSDWLDNPVERRQSGQQE